MEKQITILKDLKKLLQEHFSDNIDKVILFGSRVNGDAREYSDYDILIILKNNYDWKFKNEISALSYEIDLKYDILTDINLISIKELQSIKGKQPYIINAIEKGISV